MTTTDLEKIKKLLSQGYQVSSQTMSGVKIEGTKDKFTTTIKIELSKGDDKKEIGTDESEVFEFMLHFVKFKDQYHNFHFVYVDNYQKHQNIDANQLPSTFVDKHIIEIGSRKFDVGVWVTYITPPKTPNQLPQCEFFIDIQKNPELEDIDLKDNVKLIDKETGKIVFTGFIDLTYKIHDSHEFLCIGTQKSFVYGKISIASFEMDPKETMYFIAKCGGMKIGFDNGSMPKFGRREFIIIMPITNLVLQENISIAGTTIYHKLDSYEDHLIRKSENAIKDPDWNGNNLRIRTKVIANDFYSAVMEGHRKISSVMDCIAFRSDFSFLNYSKNSQKIEVPFSSYRYFSRIRTLPKIFCKERNNNSHLIFDLRTIIENKLVFDYQANDFFEPVRSLFEVLLNKDSDSLSPQEKTILLSCHWLRLGIFAGNLTERLIFLYNALEFIVSGIKTTKNFSSSDISSIISVVNPLPLTADQKQRLIQKVNDLNNSSLMELIQKFCLDKKIPISDEEWKVIRETRTKRNEVIHGRKDVTLELNELEKLQTLIERILIMRLQDLESPPV